MADKATRQLKPAGRPAETVHWSGCMAAGQEGQARPNGAGEKVGMEQPRPGRLRRAGCLPCIPVHHPGLRRAQLLLAAAAVSNQRASNLPR